MPKIQQGDRFGRLTVIEKTEERKNRYIVWKCRCQCGNELLADTRSLSMGMIRDCGCVPKKDARKGRISEDLTGRRFGQLTVIQRAANIEGRVAWLCRYDCGKEKIISTHALKTERTRSCGCLKHNAGRGIADLSGQRFGRLTVLHPTNQRDLKGSVFWKCRCDCGNTVKVTQSNLVYGTYRSCGCLRREYQENVAKQLHMIDGTCVELIEKGKRRSDNTSGFRGVCKMKNQKYRVDPVQVPEDGYFTMCSGETRRDSTGRI
ncbi:MAG: transcriptional regulator [Clostridiales bacterium]|nr:transcriptional regulator [Clostridiales bacterium]